MACALITALPRTPPAQPAHMDFPVKEGDTEEIDDLDMPMTFELALEDDTKVAFFEGTCQNPGLHKIETINAGEILVRPTRINPPPTPTRNVRQTTDGVSSPSSNLAATAKLPHQPHP